MGCRRICSFNISETAGSVSCGRKKRKFDITQCPKGPKCYSCLLYEFCWDFYSRNSALSKKKKIASIWCWKELQWGILDWPMIRVPYFQRYALNECNSFRHVRTLRIATNVGMYWMIIPVIMAMIS
jgi:hypothetical protein